MQLINILIALGIGAVLAIFAIENMAEIDVSFLGQEFKMRRIALIGGTFAAGFVSGKLIKLMPKL